MYTLGEGRLHPAAALRCPQVCPLSPPHPLLGLLSVRTPHRAGPDRHGLLPPASCPRLPCAVQAGEGAGLANDAAGNCQAAEVNRLPPAHWPALCTVVQSTDAESQTVGLLLPCRVNPDQCRRGASR